MRIRSALVVCYSAAAFATSCDTREHNIDSAEIAIAVSPLSLFGITDACYTLTVTNAPGGGGAVVWTKSGVCSSAYGNGEGDLAYVGPCDASTGTNTVLLELTSLTANGGTPEFVNPCGAPDTAPCQREITCVPNADRPVTFDLTIMRPASQGFFDVAVEFSDIFCSAKLDCSEATGGGEAPIALLFGPDGGPRLPTIVVGLACTGGAAADTILYWDGVALECGAATIPLPITGTPGNVYGPGSTPPAPLAQVATYRGSEALIASDGTPWSKVYYNLAFALDFDAVTAPCDLVATATASDGPFTPPFLTPADATYPIIKIDARVVAGLDATSYACTRHPLGRRPADLIWTHYTDGSVALDLRARQVSGSVVVEPAPAGITATTPAAFDPTAIGQTGATRSVTLTATGPGHLVVGAITTTGDFAVAAHDCGVWLAPGATCELDVSFTPTAAGTRNGTLRVTSNASGSPTEILLSGVGYGALTIAPTNTSVAINGSLTFSAAGGVAPYTFAVVPPGGGSFAGAVYTAPGTVQNVTVKVTDTLGHTAEATVSVFNPAPTIASVTPNVGVNTGGTSIAIVGTNFALSPSGSVTVGGASCAVTAWTATSIQCTTPAGVNGARNVVVTNYDTLSATLAGGFTYTDPEGWVALSTTGAPSARYLHTAVWTGSKMLIVGGTSNGSTPKSDAFLYDPAADTWAQTPIPPTYQAWSHSVVWTGTTAIFFGGHPGGAAGAPYYSTNDGSRYNASTGAWTATSTGANVPKRRRGHCAVWTGSVMIVWGGYNNQDGELGDGARYNPASDTWTTMSNTNAPFRRHRASCAWTGTSLVVFGGSVGSGGNSNTGGIWDQATNTWSTLNITNGPGVRDDHATVWTGAKMIVWSGYSPGPTTPNTGAAYDPTSNTWAQLSTVAAPIGRYGPVAVWTGSQMIVWGGADRDSGGVYTPATDTWAATSTANAPSGSNQTAAVWTGSKMIVWGGYRSVAQATGARYTPSP